LPARSPARAAARRKACARARQRTWYQIHPLIVISEYGSTRDSYQPPSLPWPDEWLAQTFELSVSFEIQFWIVEPPQAV